MSDRVTQHERMRRYLKHRERVFEAKSVIETGQKRSVSVKSRPPSVASSRHATYEQLKVSNENERLLKALIRISEKPGPYSKKTLSRPSSSLPRRS